MNHKQFKRITSWDPIYVLYKFLKDCLNIAEDSQGLFGHCLNELINALCIQESVIELTFSMRETSKKK